MSEATRIKTIAMRDLYRQFDSAMISYFATQSAAQEHVDESVFGLAQRVMTAIDRLPLSLQKQFQRRREFAEDFMTVYGTNKPVRPASPETAQRFTEQVCSVGQYSPV